MNQIEQMKLIIAAEDNGSEIEWRYRHDPQNNWHRLGENIYFEDWHRLGENISEHYDFRRCVYRLKPAPPKPLEFWIAALPELNINQPAFKSEVEAINCLTKFSHDEKARIIHVREVITGEPELDTSTHD